MIYVILFTIKKWKMKGRRVSIFTKLIIWLIDSPRLCALLQFIVILLAFAIFGFLASYIGGVM